jgi:hypothetical protein
VKRAFEAAGVEFIEENGGDLGVRLRNDGSEINKVIVPVIFGPRIVSGYVGFRVHVVRRGDTLSAIAKDNYGDARRYNDIVRANPLIVSDPDRIFPASNSRYRLALSNPGHGHPFLLSCHQHPRSGPGSGTLIRAGVEPP